MGKRKPARTLTKLQVGDTVRVKGVTGPLVLIERRDSKIGVKGWIMRDSEGRARAFTDDRIT
jgi:hypothetical protein